MAANVIESFLVGLGFEVNTEKLEEFKHKTDELRESAATIGTLFTGAAGAIGLFVTRVAAGIDELADFTALHDASIVAAQELGYAAQLEGSSLDAVKNSIAGVNRTVGEAVLGIGRGAKTFEKLGMSAKNADGSVKSFDQVLTEVADKFVGLSRPEQTTLAEKLGIDASLVPLLNKGTDAIEALRKEARLFGVVSAEDAEKAGALNDSLDRTKFLVGAVGKTIAVGFMPAVTAVVDSTREWLLVNAQLVKSSIAGTIKVVSAVIGTMWDWVVRLVGSLKEAVVWLSQFRVVTYLAAAALGAFLSLQAYGFVTQLAGAVRLLTLRMAAFNATALVVPAVIGAIILALGLLIDDYANWKEGNDSVLGGLVEQFPMLLGFIQTIEQFVGALVDFWQEQWETLQGPVSELAASIWQLASTVVSLLWPVIRTVFIGWGYILAAVIPVIARLIGFIAGGLVSAVAALIEAGTWLADVFTSFFGGIKSGFDVVASVIDAVTARVMRFVDMVTGAVSAVGRLLGLSGNGSIPAAVSQAPAVRSAGAGRYESTPWASRGGVIGSAGVSNSSNSTTTQTTQITAPITINSPDPTKAGEAVRAELDRMNKQTVRNGQSAVAL
jgi:hypothetical protein